MFLDEKSCSLLIYHAIESANSGDDPDACILSAIIRGNQTTLAIVSTSLRTQAAVGVYHKR